MRRLWRVAAGMLLFLCACSHRVPIAPDDSGPESVPSIDLLLLPDGPRPDIGVPKICWQDQVPWVLHEDPRGNYALVTPSTTAVSQVKVSGAASTDSAAALNLPGVAALLATRGTAASSPLAEMGKIQQHFFDALVATSLGQGTVRASGSSGTSAEKLPDVKEAIWDIQGNTPIEPGDLRNMLLASVLQRPKSSLSNLPGPVGSPTGKLMVKVTLALRPGQIVVSAAVTSRSQYDTSDELAFLMDDLSNGTAVAKAGRQPVLECDIQAIAGKPVADIIWIVDESGSMNDNRQDIVNNATNFFQKALAAGLDFRMGVAGVKKPSDLGIKLGKFCSDGNGSSSDEGGEDRFLLPSEKSSFTSCIKNPPYYEGGSEYGLTHGYWAVKNHLPREANSLQKIRKEAHLAVIFVTDETSQELKQGSEIGLFGQKGFLSYQDYKKDNCTLTKEKQSQMQQTLKPLLDLYNGVTDAEAKASVHVIGGTCNNLCNAEIAHGYQELVTARGGQLGDVCQHDLNATLQVIINSITASASPRVLGHIPISSTLTVEANGLQLKRSRTQGYTYNPNSNSLTFINVQIPKGAVVVASYRRFP